MIGSIVINAMNEPGKLRATIIVPVYRDWVGVRNILSSFSTQGRADCEIIIVDNEPEAGAVPLDLPDPGGMPWRVVACPTAGSYAARNVGAEQALGSLLIFTDADCLPAQGWLENLLHHDDGKTLLAGPVVLTPGIAPNIWAIFDTVRGMPQDAFLRHGYAVTANLAIPFIVFSQTGGFDARRLSGGDAEFCRRSRRAGFNLKMVPEAVVLHPARRTWEALVLKARRIKGGQVASGPFMLRAFWIIRSFTPPVRELFSYSRSPHPAIWRMSACAVRLLLWGVELIEMFRLLLGQTKPERR